MKQTATSITQFLTDGSLASLCDALSVLLGTRVQLIDEHEQHLLVSHKHDELSIHRVHSSSSLICSMPITVRRNTIGAIAIEDGPAWKNHEDECQLTLGTLASIIGELCEYRLSMKNFERELDILDSLTRHLVTGRGLEAILRDGLRAAIELVGADAGTIRTLDPSTNELLLVASEGFSEVYKRDARAISTDESLV
ncbi:MAG: hypothetical protein ACYTF7_11570, partial [Planctomycetota bacterium]